MKKKVLVAIAASLLITNPHIGYAQKKWTLKECIDYAMANNITLQKAKLTEQSAREDVLQAKASLLPSLSATTNQSVGYRPWIDGGTGMVANGTVANGVEKTYYNGSYGVNANWTVWNGNKNHMQVKQNKMTEQQAALTSSETANSIQEQIAKLYIQILYQTEAIEVNKQSLATSMKNEQRGKEMVEVGKMSKADLAQLTAQTAQDQYNVVSAQSSLANYKLQLKQLLELSGQDDFDIMVPESSDQQALQDIPSLMNVYGAALEQRPEIGNAKLDIESKKLSVSMAKTESLPTISLTGGVGTSTTSMNDKEWGTQIKTNFDTSVGATVSVPIFDNRSRKTAVNKAQIACMESELSLKDKQKQLYSTIEGYWLDAQTNQQKFKAASVSVDSEQASYDLLSEQFRLGLKNIVELMTGKTNLLTAKQNQLQSKYMTILDIQLLNFYEKGVIE